MDDLSLVQTQDLLAELVKRFDSVVFVSGFAATDEDGSIRVVASGGAVEALGLASYAVHYLARTIGEDPL